MPQYRYTANTSNGEIVDGTVDAVTAEQARFQLESDGLLVQSLREKTGSVWNISFSFYISIHEITFFTKNFSVMLGAGLTVVDALIISESQASGKFKRILHHILQNVESGHSLADGFQKYRRHFPGTYIEVIRNGELSGTLADGMAKLATHLESDLELRRKIQTALIYPIIVVSAIIALVIVLSVYVLPRLTRLFTSLNIELPPTTKFILWVSTFMTANWLYVLVVAAAIVIGLRLLVFIPPIRNLWHRILLRLPVIGKISRNVHLARFSSTLGGLLKSGVPIAESFDSVIHSASNEVYRERLREALQHIEQGGSLAGFLDRHKRLFPATVTRMVAVGERTGQLDDILLYLAKYYEVEVDSSTKQLSTTLEPLLLIIIGAAVLFVGLSIITPIYQFTASVGKI